MFNKLKDKFKDVINKFSDTPEEKVLIVDKKIEKDNSENEGVISKVRRAITTSKISESRFEEIFWELELGLLENNVAIEVIEKIKENLKLSIVDVAIEKSKIKNIIHDELKNSLKELFDENDFDIFKDITKKEGPYVILFVGVNGSGKTTTIVKIANLLKSNKVSSVLSASDTFRAAAIDQLQHHSKVLDIPIIKHDYGSDPSAVAFDSIKYAKSKNIDVVLIDTAGRNHSNTNLVEELKKINRISKPDLKIFVGESITGNDCIEQSKKFNDAIDLDGIILTKSDVDERGGTSISISYILGKPIFYNCTGQGYSDIEKFSVNKIMEALGW